MSSFEDKLIQRHVNNLDRILTRWMARHGLKLLRVALGIIFFWFGMLKFFPGVSPAESLVRKTIYFINPDIFIPLLAAWETLIGIGLITGKYMRITFIAVVLTNVGHSAADHNSP